MKLCQERRGVYVNQHFMQNNRVEITYELPMAEVVFDFYDKLKSGTRGTLRSIMNLSNTEKEI